MTITAPAPTRHLHYLCKVHEILTLDLDTLEYRTKKRAKFATLEKTKTVDNLKERYPILIDGDDKAAQFYRKNFGELFAYIQHRIPEISDEIYRIDDAMKAGFGWTHGPFELWDSVGLKTGVMLIEEAGHTPAAWVLKMVEGDHLGFYELSNGQQCFYNIPKKKMSAIPGQNGFVILDNIQLEKIAKITEGNAWFQLYHPAVSFFRKKGEAKNDDIARD